jgi:hypothetical protein
MDELFFAGQEGAGEAVLPQGTAEDRVLREEEGGFGDGAVFGTEAEDQGTEQEEEEVQHGERIRPVEEGGKDVLPLAEVLFPAGGRPIHPPYNGFTDRGRAAAGYGAVFLTPAEDGEKYAH